MAAQTGARGKGAADCSRKDRPSRADSRQKKMRGRGGGACTTSAAVWTRQSRLVSEGNSGGGGGGGGGWVLVGAGVWTTSVPPSGQGSTKCVCSVFCFLCLLCSERKIIAFISSVFLKLFDIKIIFFLLGE